MNYTTPAIVKTALAGALDHDQCWDGSINWCAVTS
jgi:hypothetical protein